MKILDELTNREMFFLLAGPCVIEGEEMALNIAGHITAITQRLGIPYVFKAVSYTHLTLPTKRT